MTPPTPGDEEGMACERAYQQQRRVDVDVLKHNELFLRSDGEQPWTVEFSFHPVPHAAVLPFEGSGQSPGRTRRRAHRVRGGERGPKR